MRWQFASSDPGGAARPPAWLDEQDGNEEWPRYVRIVLGQLAHELGYELRRLIAPVVRLQGEAPDPAMAGIGVGFAVTPERRPAIEDVLFFASEFGMEENDFRVLNVLCKWIDVHASRINADRRTRLVEACAGHERTRAFWAAAGQGQHRDRRSRGLRRFGRRGTASTCFWARLFRSNTAASTRGSPVPAFACPPARCEIGLVMSRLPSSSPHRIRCIGSASCRARATARTCGRR